MNRRRIEFTPANWTVVIMVTVLCALSVALFFAGNRRVSVTEPLHSDSVAVAADEDNHDFDEYYNEEADAFERILPADKRVLLRQVDDANHRIIYYETSANPSCYFFDLETRNTSVIFGGEDGFYIGTKLIFAGAIRDVRLCGDRAVFIASNAAPEAGVPDAVTIFSLDVNTLRMQFVTTAADAAFLSDNELLVCQAKLLYRSLFTGEEYYSKVSSTLRLQD